MYTVQFTNETCPCRSERGREADHARPRPCQAGERGFRITPAQKNNHGSYLFHVKNSALSDVKVPWIRIRIPIVIKSWIQIHIEANLRIHNTTKIIWEPREMLNYPWVEYQLFRFRRYLGKILYLGTLDR
jgi:hypothetical protein